MNPKRLSLTHLCRLATLLTIPILLSSASAQHVQQFNFSGANGSDPTGGVVVDSLGNFYGSTYVGGTSRLGVVYEISPTSNSGATETVLYNFTGSSNRDGANPRGDLIFDNAGNLYGVTQLGGTLNQGTVFELSPPSSQGAPWSETVLYSFQGPASDGAQPVAGLALDGAGNLYGTTSLGGVGSENCDGGCGIAFELSPPAAQGAAWTETVLYFFQGGGPGNIGDDGSNPLGRLIFDQMGNLYSTTSMGGSIGGGTIFELSPPAQSGGAWSEAILYSIGEGGSGAPQAGVTWGPNGALFGTTLFGPGSGGAVFRLQPPSKPGGNWSFAVIYAASTGIFSGVTISNPHTLYGITGADDGTVVFQISNADGRVTVTTYGGVSGFDPGATMIIYNGAMYGTTEGGGYKNNGTVFRLR
jgi:uncharacterized repeat protein (TIGR03803 family)